MLESLRIVLEPLDEDCHTLWLLLGVVTISVAGLKNNPPSFATSTDRRVVPADFPSSSFIAQLFAMDLDSG
ncbi:hypothetical protein AB9K17_24115, partial [Salmonella enterica subsp. enterica serovar Kentucky]|uniref:hypothetical protein n=1 Tax=Salmonella enterica TaxID=28901 RepID=UPI003F4B610E